MRPARPPRARPARPRATHAPRALPAVARRFGARTCPLQQHRAAPADRRRVRTDLNAEGTGRDLLFSNPGAELPDVYLSKSVIFASEGDADQYSVVLTHPPGMREDETVRAPPKRACEAGARGFVDAL